MDESSQLNLILIIVGTCSLLLLSAAVVFFFFKYQQNLLDHQQKQHEQENNYQRQLFEAVLQTQENEQSRIANDLHDELGPLLSVVKMREEVFLRKQIESNNKKYIADSIDLLNESINTVRRISHDLMPPDIERNGLIYALTSLSDEVNRTGKINFKYECLPKNTTSTHLNKNQEMSLYRIVLELLHNTLKHANANKIELTCIIEDKEIEVNYSDNGIGFNFEDVKKKRGLGLDSLKSRTKILGGTINVASTPGNGFLAKISVPALKSKS